MSQNVVSKCEQCIVRKFGALKSLSKKELLSVSDCKTNQFIAKGEYLFKEGTHLNGVFCIKSGICKLTKLSSNGKNQIVKFIKKGDLLGQRSLISDETVNLSAIAIEEMEVCFVPRAEILDIFKSNPDFSAEIINDICYDLKMANDSMVNMAQKPVRSRFSKALLDLKEEFGVDENGFLQITLSREEFANIVGTATESMIRMISDFSKKELIATEGKKIKVVNDFKLEQLAEDL
ncbi:Crp/Fnr family transcriptional regulator [Galbibacter mesophilus]|uniref:Crp/Fnr family transcriptional regulator n=1 Tax=Galbibacter mesophilus TaxID=379069 RepID=UPI001A927918|nr:Crp/Fnr family transcriptional regulator [Galbibacter mesophilus]MCM5664218.1 Crp/Fnr family transcriptional regulator [Galbibacter mesophilus]